MAQPPFNPATDPATAFLAKASPSEILNYIRQFTNWRAKFPLTVEDFRWIADRQSVALTTSVTSNNVTLKVPANQIALIFSLEGQIAFNLPGSETLAVTGLGNLSVADRIQVKGMNCRVALSNIDRKWKLFETSNLPLSQITKMCGGEPLTMNPPYVLADGEQMKTEFELTSTESTIVGASTDYGGIYKILLVRAKS